MFSAQKPAWTLVSAALVSLAVMSCAEHSPPKGQQAQTPLILAEVSLDQPVRVLGTEPFWHLDITPATLTYGEMNSPDEQVADNTGPSLHGTTAIWVTQTQAGLPMKITLSAIDCSDGMSDRIYPLTAKVEVGQQTLNGCAAALSAIENVGKAGRVE